MLSDICQNARVTAETVSAGSQTVHNRNLQDNAQNTLQHRKETVTKEPLPQD